MPHKLCQLSQILLKNVIWINEITGIHTKYVLFSKTIFYYRKSELSWFRIVHFCLFKFIFGVEVSSSSFLLLQEVLLNADTLTLSQRIRPRQEYKDKKQTRKYQRFILKGPVQFPSNWWPDDGYWWINIKEFFGNNKLLLWALSTSCGGLSISVLRWRIFFEFNGHMSRHKMRSPDELVYCCPRISLPIGIPCF